ncbi:undecaprenyl-phosphate glucose phosphotransferase [Klebsiella quasivariicola]|uniref:undecaprenyl-phosphate glucose phosphotransferase n=1 Tax=Klebsiella quasivariicola TaxID=2026240 RepID=UPI0024785CE2|nr:undecaprenyl-phosphate glucose phosphotransferase [Klebsiella quasivariicola]
MISKAQRVHSKANASLISMLQRFSDIFMILAGLYLILKINKQQVDYKFLVIFLIGLAFFQMIGGITDFYRSWRGVNFSAEISLIIRNWSGSFLFTLGIVYFFSFGNVKAILFLEWYFIVIISIVLSRGAIRVGAGFFRRMGYNTRNVAVAGGEGEGINLLNSFKKEAWLGFNVIGIYDDTKNIDTQGLPYVGNLADLVVDAKNGKLDRIYISLKMSESAKIKSLITELTDTTCSVSLIPDMLTFNILQSRTEEINGIPVVPLFDTPLNGINMVIKRMEDIVLSFLILLLISPLLICISLAVKLTSSGPVIFKQIRYGMDGKPIKVWKFRSMKVMENDSVVTQAKKHDVRVTTVGKYLRKTSLDELPQFINVLMGNMSIVGPRPHAVAHNEQYRKLIRGYMLRHKVKPGITGWAQINGWRGETDTIDKMEKRVEFDLEYIRSWSLFFDFKIIFLTIFKGFVNKSAY